jgi:hypothetical protein
MNKEEKLKSTGKKKGKFLRKEAKKYSNEKKLSPRGRKDSEGKEKPPKLILSIRAERENLDFDICIYI